MGEVGFSCLDSLLSLILLISKFQQLCVLQQSFQWILQDPELRKWQGELDILSPLLHAFDHVVQGQFAVSV
jgi:hypothetical protein